MTNPSLNLIEILGPVRFQRLIATILEHEGGHANVKGDVGGETCFGIIKRTHSRLSMREIIEWDELVLKAKRLEHPPTPETLDLVGKLYDAYFSAHPLARFLVVKDGVNAEIWLDILVNFSPKAAARIMQRSIKRHTPIKVDGVVGSKTKEAFERACVEYGAWREAILAERLLYHVEVAGKSSQLKFLRGWVRRVVKYMGEKS